ncbi:hypothetical protein M0657_012179 [Pyricularia oryzae]|nr:hypothetical protein M9X92_012110 [Pyricularia oryzae]KAI7908689.1 hypothetical protein M0657_012179 [Pyricularia oryzae]
MQESQTCQINLSDYDPQAVKLVIDFYLLDYTPSHSRFKETNEGGLQLKAEAVAIQPGPEHMKDDLTLRSKKDEKSARKSAAGYESPDVEQDNLAQALRPETFLIDHCDVYTLADYLQVNELKVLAASKFRAEAKKHWNHSDFYETIQSIYGTSTPNDRLLRDIVVDVIKEHKELLDRFEYQDLVSQLDLSFELLMAVHKTGKWA